jgi:dipeptidyl aminopeptidase/acylaminoacyl peptidase
MTIRFSYVTAVLAASILLSSCGGGGGASPIIPPEPYQDQMQQEFWIPMRDGIIIHAVLHRPHDSSPSKKYPGLVLIPGGIQPLGAWHAREMKSNAWEFVNAGLVAIAFDARGRGLSGGSEDFNGKVQQDDLAEIIEWLNARPEVEPGGVGVATSSWGITLGAGTLGRHPDLPALFLVDLEGASDRFVMTQWDDPKWVKIMHGHGSWDDEFWKDREAIKYMGDIACAYFRIQSNYDHALDRFYVDHAINMVNAAVNGKSPYVQLNDMPPNQLYDIDKAHDYQWVDVDESDKLLYGAVIKAFRHAGKLD